MDGGRGDWRGCTRIGTRFAMVPTKDSTQEADRHTQTVQGTRHSPVVLRALVFIGFDL